MPTSSIVRPWPTAGTRHFTTHMDSWTRSIAGNWRHYRLGHEGALFPNESADSACAVSMIRPRAAI
jgi:hypothetical protein